MQITPVDHYNDLFKIVDIISPDLQEKVIATDWLNLKFQPQSGQESWPRRRIDHDQLPWIQQWEYELDELWPKLQTALNTELEPYGGTAFWLDEPGFICAIHTDGEMPGSLHINWIGSVDLATVFYHSKNFKDIRFTQKFAPNSGYAMINVLDHMGYRHLQWHGMLTPVPANTYRLTSYTWLVPRK